MKKYIVFIVFSIVFVPSFALASWWNPISWFKKAPIAPVVVPTPVVPLPVSEKKVEKPVVKKETPKVVIKKETPKLTSTKAEVDDIVATLDEILGHIIKDITTIVDFSDKLSNFGYDYRNEVYEVMGRTQVVMSNLRNLEDQILLYREDALRTQYVEYSYWKSTRLLYLMSKLKEIDDDFLDALRDFNSATKRTRNNLNSYNYDYVYPTYGSSSSSNGCDEVEQEIRNGGGFITESQVQALLRNKGC